MYLLVSSDNVVKYVSVAQIMLRSDHALVGDLTVLDMTPANARIVETQAVLPTDWAGNAYLWTAGGFVRNPAYQVAGDPRVSLVILDISADKLHAAGTIVDLPGREVKCPIGTLLNVKAEIRDSAGALLPLTQAFCMPISCRYRDEVLLVKVVDGAAHFSATMAESGVWKLSSETINANLPPQLQFLPFEFSVYVYKE